MKRLFLLAFLLLIFGSLSAQYTCGEIKLDRESQEWGRSDEQYKNDRNGHATALIIVNFKGTTSADEIKKFSFDAGEADVTKVEKPGSLWVYVTGGIKKFEVQNSDYGNQQVEFKSIDKKKTYTLQITVTHEKLVTNNMEIVSNFNIRTNVDNANIEMTVNDQKINGVTPYNLPLIPSGQYRIKITKEMYKPYIQVIEVSKANHDFYINMEKDYADITFKVDDPEVSISIDGQIKGKGTVSQRLISGPHTAVTSKPSHKNQTKSFTVVASKDQEIKLDIPTPIYGTIELKSNVDNPRIVVDGKEVSPTYNIISKTTSIRNQVLIGSHTLTAKKPFYHDKTIQINVSETGSNFYNINMERNVKDLGLMDRRFMNVTYSTRGTVGYMAGGMYDSSFGLYNGYQIGIKGLYMYPNMKSQNRRFSMGMVYAFTDWWYVYGGAGLAETITETDSIQTVSFDLGFQFRIKGVSLMAGAEYDLKGINNNNLFYNFGLGFNVGRSLDYPHAQIQLYYSPSAPLGIGFMWHGDGLAGYFKVQTPLLENTLRKKYHRQRFSLTGGTTYHITNWLSYYMGVGIGGTKEYNTYDSTYSSLKWGLDLETGLTFNIHDAFSLSIGAHRVNALDLEKSYTEFEVGIGTRCGDIFGDLFYAEDDRTFFEYNYSSTAPYGFMTGVSYEGIGYYGRLQLSGFLKDTLKENEKFAGKRYSMTVGTVFNLFNWFAIEGGIGGGLYKHNLWSAYKVGFEAELGAKLMLGPVSFSAGPHWCFIGNSNHYLDWNFGVGIASRELLDMEEVDFEGAFLKYVYTAGAPLGGEWGYMAGPFGGYMGMMLGNNRFNFSAGAIVATSAINEIQLGFGMGFYGQKLDDGTQKTDIGFDLEAEYNINLGRVPISLGAKFCRVGSSNFFVEPMIGIGIAFSTY